MSRLTLALNMLSFAGLMGFCAHFVSGRTLKRSESTLAMFLLSVGLHLFCRTFYWADTQAYLWGCLTYMTIGPIPFFFGLHVEELQRRHLPPLFKVGLVVFGVAVLVLGGFRLFPANPPLQMGLMATVSVLSLGFVGELLRPAPLAPFEQSAVRSTVSFYLLLLVIMQTDMPLISNHLPVNMGALGILAFVFLASRINAKRQPVPRALLALFISTLICLVTAVVFCFAYLGRVNSQNVISVAAFALTVFLIYLIFRNVQSGLLKSREALFLKWLGRAEMGDLDAMMRDLDAIDTESDYHLLRESDLTQYGLDLVHGVFNAVGKDILSREEFLRVRRQVSKNNQTRAMPGGGREGYDQLLDLFATHQLTHLGRWSVDSKVFLGARVPHLESEERAAAELRIILNIARSQSARAG